MTAINHHAPDTTDNSSPVSGIAIADFLGDYDSCRELLRAELARCRADTLEIKPRISGSAYAEEFGVIPSGVGAKTGAITLYGYQRGVLDAFCDVEIPFISVLKSAQVGYTRMLLLAMAYHLEHDPTSCVIVQPTNGKAEEFARDQVHKVLAETKSLAKLRRPVTRADTRDTLTQVRLTNGGNLRLVGAESGDSFRIYAARWQAADELDSEGWNDAGDIEGDKLTRLWNRGDTFWNRKQIRGSTPVIEETSRIYREWSKSDQRRYFVPCPHCSEMQYLEWGSRDIEHGVKWMVDAAGKLVDVWYVCRHCHGRIEEHHKLEMDAAGEWRPTAEPEEPGHVGFHIWAGMSLHPNASWFNLVKEWLNAQKDPANRIQPFINTKLGLPYKLSYGQELKLERFTGRREAYPAEFPPGVVFLTAGVDVQSGQGKDPRLEVSIYGWGRGHEAWLIGHFVLKGDPAQPQVWSDLYALLKRGFLATDGIRYAISAAAIDSGGHNTAEVYAFASQHAGDIEPRIWAIKGASEINGKRKPVWPRKPSRGKNNATLYIIGGNAARDFVRGSLEVDKPGPRYVHFPSHTVKDAQTLDDEWFRQLTREKRTIRRGVVEWVKPAEAHEAGVCLVYAYAAVCGLQAADKKFLKQLDIPQDRSTTQRNTAEPAADLQSAAEDPSESSDVEETDDDEKEAEVVEIVISPPEPTVKVNVPTPIARSVDAPKKVIRRRRVVRSSFMSR